jgi:hydrogenase maturation protease
VKTLVLGLGNELLGDDGIGIVAARALRGSFPADAGVEVVESQLAGLALLDLFLGYDRAIVIDGIRTGRRPPGEVVELTAADLDPVVAPSPHYAGLPEMFAVARRLDLHFPADVRILAVETEDPWSIGRGLTDAVRRALPDIVARVRGMILPGTGESPAADRPQTKETHNA